MFQGLLPVCPFFRICRGEFEKKGGMPMSMPFRRFCRKTGRGRKKDCDAAAKSVASPTGA